MSASKVAFVFPGQGFPACIIIAINKNPEAPIFNAATIGIDGDVYESVPVRIRKIKDLKG